MRHTLIAILGVLLFCNPPLSHADSDVDYSPAMEEYIGTWVCISSNIDGQWIPLRIEIKKKGKKLNWTFYRNSGKAPKDFYDGPYVFGDSFDGHFTFGTTPLYRDSRPSHQNYIKYEFRTTMRYDELYIFVTLYHYNDFGEIVTESYNVCYGQEG